MMNNGDHCVAVNDGTTLGLQRPTSDQSQDNETTRLLESHTTSDWSRHFEQCTKNILPNSLWALYCALIVPLAAFQIAGGAYDAIGSPAVNGSTTDGFWPAPLRPQEDYQRWLLAALGGGLATMTLYWKVQPINAETAGNFVIIRDNLKNIFSNYRGWLAIGAAIPGSVLTYVGTEHSPDLPDSFEGEFAMAAAICCFIVTVATYTKSLTTMAKDLSLVIKQVWENPKANKGILVFGIVMALLSLMTIPGLMASLATILTDFFKGHQAPETLARVTGASVASLLTVPFYILLLQSCIEIYQNAEKTLRQRSLPTKHGVALFCALVPGLIISSTFAFFISEGLGATKLNWIDEKQMASVLISAMGAVPAGFAFTDSSYQSFMKPIIEWLSSAAGAMWRKLPSRISNASCTIL